jgi:hypothetical protein
MKKSQMEILGIAIVVVLATLGMLFVVKYSMTSSQTTKQSYKTGTTAENFLSVLMATSTNCNGLVFSDVLKGCASGTVDCSNNYLNEGDTACEYAKELMESFLDASLGVQGLSYYIMAFKEDEIKKIEIESGDCVKDGNCLIDKLKGCTGKREATQRFLPTTSGTRTLVFYICS